MTVDVAAEHDALMECLQRHSERLAAEGRDPVGIYDSAPDDPPTDAAGRVLPHVILWGHIGQAIPYSQRGVTWAGNGEVDWRPQLTLVAGLPFWVLDCVPVVRAALAEFRTATGEVLIEQLEGGPRTPTKDPDESDTPRYFAVLPLGVLLAS